MESVYKAAKAAGVAKVASWVVMEAELAGLAGFLEAEVLVLEVEKYMRRFRASHNSHDRAPIHSSIRTREKEGSKQS